MVYYKRNVSQLLLVLSGYHTHHIQYMQKAHALRERFAFILGMWFSKW